MILLLILAVYGLENTGNFPLSFFTPLANFAPGYRIVIANSNTPDGRAAAVDCKEYAAAKQAYNLPD
jgi:hypothetical protein